MDMSTHSRERRCVIVVAVAALILGLAFISAACGVGAAVGDGGTISTTGNPPTTLADSGSSSGDTTTSVTSGPDVSGSTTTSTPATDGGSTSTTAAPVTKDTVTVNFYFMRGEKIAATSRAVAKTQAVGAAATQLLLAGPGEKEAGMTTAIPAGTKFLGLDIKNGTATVDLSKEYASGGGSLSMMMRLAQVVFTLTQFPSVKGVSFMLDGKAIDVLGGEGIIIDHPMTRADYEDLSPAILVEAPTVGTAVASPLRMTGTANVFEAVFRVNIVDHDGLVIADESVKATSGTGTRGTFDVTVTYPSGRAGNGSLIAFERSAKDGSPTNVVEIPLVLK